MKNEQLIDNTTGVDHVAFEISGTVLHIPCTQASFQYHTALNFIYMWQHNTYTPNSIPSTTFINENTLHLFAHS